ncbi:Oidioi.mRNA.OKI2018_I69.XSR.g14088.t1.cds [Oikopleura dioica]|uniref:Oidioi.mRNA.OKI2018_I69.XSR.g14088.t1.cds n=1 Tax=Oikopleura dioica TaxID=34765 RepID=A0ABN7SHI9_OIKDI|nr:Oidioi.mRNA.OKI2018_I69.XSR.g14088.t1.cds [Oikopleura dioica]
MDRYFEMKGKPAYLKAFERAKYDPNVGLVVRGPLPEEYEYMQLDHSLDDRNNFSDLCCNEPYFSMTAPRPSGNERSHYPPMLCRPVICGSITCRNCRGKALRYARQMHRLGPEQKEKKKEVPTRNTPQRLIAMFCFIFLLGAAKILFWDNFGL